MNLLNYERAWKYDVSKAICDRMELTDYQKQKLPDVLDDIPFEIMKRRKRKESTFVWRITGPLFLLWCLVIIVLYFPVKWMFTGNRYMSEREWVYRVHKKWANRLNWD